MPLRAIARLIQTMLYAQRFFPYYVYNILGGIEEDGELGLGFERVTSCSRNWTPGSGAVYSFDPVGSYEREACRAAGAAQSLVQPFLDNQVRVLCAPSYRHRLTDRLPTSTRYRASYRYTSRTRLLRSASRTQRIFLYLTCLPSLSTLLRVRRSATLRFVF